MAEKLIQTWFPSAGNVLRKRFRDDIDLGTPPPDPGGNDRDLLTYGEYKPSASTTGVISGTTLVNWPGTAEGVSDPTTINTRSVGAALTLTNRRIYGDITVTTGTEPVIFENCEFVGGNHVPSGESGMLVCSQSRSGNTRNVIIKDCTFIPRKPCWSRDAIRGVRYEAYRNDISKTTDGFGVFIQTTAGTSVNCHIIGNYVHDLTYWYPDNGVHADGSHNDCIQIQGGADIWIMGNNIMATSVKGAGSGDNPDKPWLLNTTGVKHANGAGIIVQKASSCAPLANVIIEKNWLYGGLSEFNMKPGTYTFRDNICSRTVAVGPSHSGYYCRGDNKASTTVVGLYLNNRFEDNNALMTEPQLSGIHWNS